VKGFITLLALVGVTVTGQAAERSDMLIKMANSRASAIVADLQSQGLKTEELGGDWVSVQGENTLWVKNLQKKAGVEYIQPNYKIKLLENYKIQDSLRRAAFARFIKSRPSMLKMPADNPPIPDATQSGSGDDPMFSKQWGMNDIGVKEAWKKTKGSPDMIVGVIDTGVDYTHEDLVPNMWRNPGETGKDAQGRDKATNGVDDDNNGYVDDVVGYDFVQNDNKPFDLAVEPLQLLMGGGNPGHGTHCAGNVAARGDNGKGIAGVAPNVKIMALRFISEKGEGTTAEAIRAIRYGVDNGAKVLSNSWGSEGEEAGSPENQALRDAVSYAESKGVLFVAAAGNGHQGVGYDNDTDKAPGYPASYDHENIVSVAALDSKDQLGSFSNWGVKSVDIGAPGVVVFSTTVGGNYSDTILDQYGFHVTWDGTSMACPHVAGAAALYWSAHPEKSYKEVKEALLKSAKPISSLKGKVVSEGKLDVKALLNF
jgi:subtilisin family serine protease